ncbi:hypothetical protein XELAEV_18045698mg [Xenopus laevis]|uniref:Taste receptor type 2 n=1 Tax=Xenopus laevis TaxID=8355 RepID=A0A974C187_XENLA|nr:hypothetical protein XELAEV_18045698mg [Xenopus laevis]
MGCTNLLQKCFITFHLAILAYQLNSMFAKEFLLLVTFVFLFAVSLSLWLNTRLALYYCMRLVTFSNRFFIRFKRGISSVVAHLLLGSVLISSIINVPIFWTRHVITEQNVTDIYDFINNMEFVLFNSIVGCFIPTIITSVSIGLSLMSLLKHVQRMKDNTSQFWNPQLKSHVKACRTMLLLYFLFGYVY